LILICHNKVDEYSLLYQFEDSRTDGKQILENIINKYSVYIRFTFSSQREGVLKMSELQSQLHLPLQLQPDQVESNVPFSP